MHIEHIRQRSFSSKGGHGHGGRHGMRGRGQGGFDRGGEGRRGGGRGGRRKMLDVGELRLVMLQLMNDQPRHGYDIIREIETRTGGAYAPSPGIVYPTLSLLEEKGEIEASAPEGAKRLFVLTPAGQHALAEHALEAAAIIARLEALRSADDQLQASPVGRALQNLHTVVERRFADPQEKQLLFAAADLLDEAARKIERL